MFSKTCQYAIQAILYIAMHNQNGKMVGLKEIAEKQNIPHHFLSKILQQLVRQELLLSTKGPNGGFGLAQQADEISLLTIVEIIDGLSIFDKCGIGMKVCSDCKPCPIHNDFKVVKTKIKDLLEKKTVEELCQDVHNGNSVVSYTTE